MKTRTRILILAALVAAFLLTGCGESIVVKVPSCQTQGPRVVPIGRT